MIRQKGFTLLEISVAIAMVGVMATIAVPVYQGHIAKTQVTEAFGLMEASKVKVASSMLRTGKCEIDGATTVQGKNGVLTISGAVVPEAMAFPKHTLKTGCVLTYKFNNAGVTKSIAGKTVVADLLNNSVISRSAATSVDNEYIPKTFKSIGLDTAPMLAAIPEPPKLPELPAIVESPTPSSPSNETVVAVDTKPNGEVCQDTYEKKSDETLITLGSAGHYRKEADYYVRGSINLYDIFMSEVKRAPVAGEKIKFITTCAVAFVGNSVTQPAITVGNFNNSVNLQFVNFGVVVGRGGKGASPTASLKAKDGEKAGDAIRGSNAVTLNVLNHGVIAGGGGGGHAVVLILAKAGGGGGAPYGAGGSKGGGNASFTKGGSGASKKSFRSGDGGGWGLVSGVKESSVISSHFFNEHRAGMPGYFKTGLVEITNLGDGKVLGVL